MSVCCPTHRKGGDTLGLPFFLERKWVEGGSVWDWVDSTLCLVGKPT